jgi:RNA polymerase sporulation-specific sigma factor
MISLDDEYNNLQIGSNNDADELILWKSYLETLDPLSSAVMVYRYENDLTQSEVAEILGITQVKVSRIEKSSKQKILEYIS